MLTITNYDVAAEYGDMLLAAVKRLARYQHVETAELHPTPRRQDGWLEWIMVVHFDDKGVMTVGVLQRSEGADIEFNT